MTELMFNNFYSVSCYFFFERNELAKIVESERSRETDLGSEDVMSDIEMRELVNDWSVGPRACLPGLCETE